MYKVNVSASYVLSQRDESIDVFRGLAILMVMLLHAIVMTPNIDQYPKLLKIGAHFSHGVQLFFIISGWLIAASYERGLEYGEGILCYLKRRAAKIVPLYLIFLNINIMLFLFASNIYSDPNFFRNSVSWENLSIGNYLLHVLMLQGLFPANIHTLLDGSWSIVNEVYFYLLFPLVVYKSTKTVENALLTFIFSCVVSIAFTMIIGRYIDYPGYSYYSFPVQFPLFILGIYCYRISRSLKFNLNIRHQLLILIAASILFIGTSDIVASPLGAHVLSGIIFSIVLVFTKINYSNTICKIFRSFGRQSYALFFLHLVFLKELHTHLVSRFSLEFYELLAFNIFVSVGLSWVFSFFIFNKIDEYFVRLIALRRNGVEVGGSGV